MTILIVSQAEDRHARAVMAALARFARTDVRLLDLRDFPARLSLTMSLCRDRRSDFGLSFPDGRQLSMARVQSVWWWRPRGFALPGHGMSAEARQVAITEAASAFQGMWQASEALWVNDAVRDAAARHKPWQLELARQIGLSIPETLITNDPLRVRAFWSESGGRIVYKPLLETSSRWRETRRLTRAELAKLDAVRLAPVIFQRRVPGRADVRATVIGSEVFAAAVDLRESEYPLDARLSRGAYERHELPVEVQEHLTVLIRRLGLEYGAIDLRLTPDGEYVFFKVDPSGPFLPVEQSAGLPIGAAVAAHLATGRTGLRARQFPRLAARAV